MTASFIFSLHFVLFDVFSPSCVSFHFRVQLTRDFWNMCLLVHYQIARTRSTRSYRTGLLACSRWVIDVIFSTNDFAFYYETINDGMACIIPGGGGGTTTKTIDFHYYYPHNSTSLLFQ